ncbi:MAG: response regulator [Ignavibacteriales bacterium]
MASDGKKVLICDDSLLVRTQLHDFLNALGQNLTILEAADGTIALDVFKEHRPDLVLLDVVMPNLSGIECLKEIKKIDPNAVVIMVSSVGTAKILKEAIDAGAVDFVQKPWTQGLLAEVINKTLK